MLERINGCKHVITLHAGLCLFIGIIIYIGAVTGEASNPPKSGDEPRFMYSYGPSLALTFVSFISCELTAVLAVHLYISRHRQLKTAVVPSPSLTSATAAAEVGNGRPLRGYTDRLDQASLTTTPRGELQPLNDRRPVQSNCSSPSGAALKSLTSLKHDVKSAPHSLMTSSTGDRVMTSADVRRHRRDVGDDYWPAVDGHHTDLFGPSRACVSLSSVRCGVDELDSFKRITPV